MRRVAHSHGFVIKNASISSALAAVVKPAQQEEITALVSDALAFETRARIFPQCEVM